ncbi:MAG: ATP-dependent 6-phosphofructokinase [Desulfobacterales bacterium]|nr:ATP-dependent 6-phosphofructokinase [Desulfobacterales bacterium]
MESTPIGTDIPKLGETKIPSPGQNRAKGGSNNISFVTDDELVLIDVDAHSLMQQVQNGQTPASFERAGPRSNIFFDPSKLRCALVTCGGLCPGLNDIIRSIVLELHWGYGVRCIYGIRYGLQGFVPKYGHNVIDLTPDEVSNIHERGGSVLGSSRGPQDVDEIVDCLERMNVGILFMIGGDGTLMAATRIAAAIQQRNLKISVVGVPKTIDNDIYLVSRSFGFETAVDVATRAITSAHNEAAGYPNGIGLLKLMGRHSGFIAATATLAQQDVNFVLIPEVDFDLDGPNGLLSAIEKRLADRGHAVIVAAEGAGQKFFDDEKTERDASGNIKLKDIGLYLKEAIISYFEAKHTGITIKYIDPSYMIRSLPANANDRVFCNFLGRNAVHAGMAGKTNLLIGNWNNFFVHVPMQTVAGKRKQINPRGTLWRSTLEATGQGSLKNAS